MSPPPLKIPRGASLGDALDIIRFSNETGVDATHAEKYLKYAYAGRICDNNWFSLLDYKRTQKYILRRREVEVESDRYHLDPATFNAITKYLMDNNIDFTSVTEQKVHRVSGETAHNVTVGVIYPIFKETAYIIRQTFNFNIVIEQVVDGKPTVAAQFPIFKNPWDSVESSLALISLHDNLAKFFGLKRTNRFKLWWNVLKRALKVR